MPYTYLQCCQFAPLIQPASKIARRVKLFHKGDKISNEAKQRKLAREFIALKRIKNLLFWTDIGREGASFLREQMENRAMAEHLADANPKISIEKAQKMISKSIEAQRKANNAKRRYNRSNSRSVISICLLHIANLHSPQHEPQ